MSSRRRGQSSSSDSLVEDDWNAEDLETKQDYEEFKAWIDSENQAATGVDAANRMVLSPCADAIRPVRSPSKKPSSGSTANPPSGVNPAPPSSSMEPSESTGPTVVAKEATSGASKACSKCGSGTGCTWGCGLG